jgi:4-amino-4-deoxy-L-arabinose transferase-like glycosyltransferase
LVAKISPLLIAVKRRVDPFLPLAVILLVAASLRLAYLWNDVPPLFADEIEQYVSVHSIATTGVDVDGRLRPFLYCRLDYNPPMYGIAGYTSTLIFGNTPFGWRFPAVIFGLISIVLLFLVVRQVTKYNTIALLSALLLAIEPDHIHFSRIGWEPAPNVLVCVLGAIWLSLSALRDRGKPLSFWKLVGAGIFLGLCPYTDQSASFYAALLLGSLWILNVGRLHGIRNLLSIATAIAIAFAILTPALILTITDPHAHDRGLRIATFANGINGTTLLTFLHNYIVHFSWAYLVTSGSPQPRYLSGIGILYWWYVPLVALGVICASQYIRSRALCWWLWFWLAIYPLGGALTNDGVEPHAARTIAGTPALCIFAAIGMYAVWKTAERIRIGQLRRSIKVGLVSATLLCACWSVWSFAVYYWTIYPVMSAREWESGAREAFAAVKIRQSNYRRLCMDGFSYWHIQSMEQYFLPDTPLTVIENSADPQCSQPGTLVLSTSAVSLPGFSVTNTFNGLDGRMFAVLEAH